VTRLAVLGYGQLGRALVGALVARGEREVAVWTRAPVPPRERQPEAAFFAGEEMGEAVAGAGIVFLALADGALVRVAEKLAALEPSWRGRAVLHASGAVPVAALEPLARRGAAVAACHPLRAFPAPRGGSAPDPAEAFQGAPFTIEGSPQGVEAARGLVQRLGGAPLASRVADRAGYHLAAALASNYGLLLRGWSARRFEAAGLSRAEAALASDALLRNALDNAQAAAGPLPLTGPIRRGELATVEAHLAALSGRQLLAYAALGLLLLESAGGTDGAAGIEQALRRALERAVASEKPAASESPFDPEPAR
jgi:predicted short-subunit dehydrogenase-like oxidoreductase (DUF2520 family)